MKPRPRRLAFSQQAMKKMIDVAWRSYPAEAVGLLAGNRGTVRSVYALCNLASGLAFFADPYDQYLAARKMRRAGERLIATFHSHPEGAARLSDADRRFVFEVAPTAVVVALNQTGRRVRVAGFTRTEGPAEAPAEIVVRRLSSAA